MYITWSAQRNTQECMVRPKPGCPHDLFFQDNGLTLIFAPPFVFAAVASPRTVQVLSPHRDKILVDCNPDGDRSPIYSGRFRWTDARKYVPRSQTAEIESLRGLPREVTQNSRSDVNAPPSGEADAAARHERSRTPIAPRSSTRAVPLTDPAYVRRVREYLATARSRRTDRIWDVRSEDTVRTWISQAVSDTARDGVTFSIRPITPKTFRDSFAMHLMQHQVPQKVIQTMMGHKDAKSTDWYTRVFALDVTRQLGVRFSMGDDEARRLLLPGASGG